MSQFPQPPGVQPRPYGGPQPAFPPPQQPGLPGAQPSTYPQQAYPQTGYGQPAGATPEPPVEERSGKKTAIVVLASVLPLFLIISVLGVLFGNGTNNNEGKTLIRAYVNALKDGKADQARRYLELKPTDDTRFLTQDVLDALRKGGRGITEVKRVGSLSADVVIHGQQVSLSMTPVKGSDGRLRIPPPRSDFLNNGAPLTLQGFPLPTYAPKPVTFALFPGVYEVASTAKYIAGGRELTATKSGIANDAIGSLSTEPSPDGEAKIGELLQKAIDDCVKGGDPRSPACPFTDESAPAGKKGTIEVTGKPVTTAEVATGPLMTRRVAVNGSWRDAGGAPHGMTPNKKMECFSVDLRTLDTAGLTWGPCQGDI